jgi:hypothetical protein
MQHFEKLIFIVVNDDDDGCFSHLLNAYIFDLFSLICHSGVHRCPNAAQNWLIVLLNIHSDQTQPKLGLYELGMKALQV